MRILFFTLIKITSFEESGIYSDMVREFVKNGHHIDYFFPNTKSFTKKENNYSLNSIKINLQVQKTSNFFLKFLSYQLLDYKFSNLIKKSKNHYDLLILATPSIFQSRTIKNYRLRYLNSKILLLLKDIFPDNALDLGILNKNFPKLFLYNYFKSIEFKLYKSVNKIGVMTYLNKVYIEGRFPFLKDKLFISPNSIEYYEVKRLTNRESLGLPLNKTIMVFVGNIGLPQDPIFFRKIIESSPDEIFFVIIGTGTGFIHFKGIKNDKLLLINENLSQNLIDQYLINSDYGLIILNHNFHVPNFPSKILTYLNSKLPIIAFTNSFNDLKLMASNSDGWITFFESKIDNYLWEKIKESLFNRAKIPYLSNNDYDFSVKKQVESIIDKFNFHK